MTKKGPKQPQYTDPGGVTKKAIISKWPSDTESHDRISWRLGDMEYEGPWNWTGIAAAKWRDILRLLAEMEKLTWAEACAGSTPRMKLVKVANAPTAVRQRLEAIQRDDVEVLAEVHMSGMQRIWGARRGNVCHLLWWDPSHQVWPSPKKHT